jgi:diphosphomevalonate decarboxylase
VRVKDTPRRLAICREAILQRDFERLAAIAELDSNMMHAVMMTSLPAIFYWSPCTLEVMQMVTAWRQQDGLEIFYTIDAGPNVHCLCIKEQAEAIEHRLKQLESVKTVLRSGPGGPAHLIEDSQHASNHADDIMSGV